jgi:membrane-bound lytic murein transglycosylase D
MTRFVLPAGLLLLFVIGGIALPMQSAREAPAASPPATPPAWAARLDALERENVELRASIEDLRRQITPVVTEPAPLLERYPVPAAVSLCGERIPLERADVYQRFEEEWTRFLVNQHWLIKWLRRSRDVFPYIEAQLAAADMPADLKYILVVESGLESRAYSSAGAAGWWQFIRSTGKRYGLDRDNLVDERRDLGLATAAALEYFTELHEEFQSWPLALSAYNAGERRVREEIEEQGEQDFYDLSLPRETEAYWFKAAALKVIFESPEVYGLDLPEDPWVATICDTLQLKVTTPRLALREIAEGAGISYREFRELNPAYRKSWIPRGVHRIVLPHETVDPFVATLEGATLDSRQRGAATAEPEGVRGGEIADDVGLVGTPAAPNGN